MTEEKEIIYIDGVDVAGCEYALTPKKQCPAKPMYYAKETSCIACKEHNTNLNFCKNNPNCYYKQLMFANKKLEAAKAETEKLVSTIWIMSGEITDLRNEKERLHNELVEAKGEQLGTLIRYNKILEGKKRGRRQI